MKLFKRKEKDIPNINSSRSFVFIHIPKNAGTSVYKALGMEASAHYRAEQLKMILGEKKYSRLFSFAFIRHPLERFLSLYHYARMEESYYHSSVNPEKALYGKHMDYELLKDKSVSECAHLLIEGKLQHDRTWNQWRPQSEWVLDKDGQIIVDYLGRLEDFDLHLGNISRIIKYPMKVSMLNKSDKSSVHSYQLDPETTQLLFEYYKSDFQLFNYNT